MLNLGHMNLDVWKDSMNFVTNIYQITRSFPQNELYGITSQIIRVAISVPSNIAEGASRNSSTERRRYYKIARSSLVELDTQLEICNSLEYLSSENLDPLSKSINKIFARLTNLIQRTV